MGAFGPVPGGRFLSARASLVVRERAGCWLLAWLLCMINLSTSRSFSGASRRSVRASP